MFIQKRKKKFAISILLFTLLSFTSNAQVYDDPLGLISQDEIALKECSFDKEAEAVILFDKASSNYNDQYNLVTERRIRIKILKQKGIERGNIRIRYYSGNDFEYISRIEGMVLNFNSKNEVEKSVLDRKSVYDRKLNTFYSEITFALPNVKVGSILEYRYTSTMKHYGGLEDWYFQSDIPTVQSFYHLTIVPNAEFTYGVYKSSFMPIDIKPNPRDGYIRFEMKNIPALRDEAYMASGKDYIQRVSFQFAGMTGRSKNKTTWKELARDLAAERYFGGQINKSLPNIDAVKALWEKETTPFAKMKVIHDFVRANITWNNIYSKYSMDGIKNAWEKRKGTTGDIALILINLLNEAGLEAYPLLVSERDHGRVDTTYPFLDQFNKVVAYVKLNNQYYILDGTDYHTPSFMIPYDLLNTTGFIVDRKNHALIRISDNYRNNSDFIAIQGAISESGEIKGAALVKNYHYSKLANKRSYLRDKVKYREQLTSFNSNIELDSLNITGLDNDSSSMDHNIKFHYSLEQSGDYHLLHYNLFTGFDKNPFVAEHRFSNIDFGTKYTCTFTGFFTLPKNLVLESLPKSKKLVTPGNSMVIARDVQQQDANLIISIKIEYNQPEFSADEYEMVKAFYKQLFELLNEPVVLKTKRTQP